PRLRGEALLSRIGPICAAPPGWSRSGRPSRSPLWRTGRQVSTRQATSDARGDPLHTMQFRPPPPPQVRDGRQPDRPLGVTVTVRWTPLLTAAYGTRVARPARTTRLAPGGDGSQLDPRVRPAHGDDCPRWQAVKAARQPGFPLGYESFEHRSEESSPAPKSASLPG